MTVKQLRAFLAVAQHLNFLQASEQLHMSQPALSLAVKGLEEYLGGALLIRTTRSVTLTPEGELFVGLARQLLADWDSIQDKMRQRFTLQQGAVSVAAIPAFAANHLPGLLKRFYDRFPGIHITVHDVINEQVMEMVRARKVEIGVCFEPPPGSSLQFEPLGSDKLVAVLPADSPLARRATVSWAQLQQYAHIALQRPSALRLLLEQRLAKHGMALEVAFESHHLATIGRMVACGLGCSAVPELCLSQMHELGAVCRPLKGPEIVQRVGMVTSGPDILSAAAGALAEVIRSAPSPWGATGQ
ncbi:LysR family transcriptional regulator [Shimwellia pseudoproteus]|uniref:LysR family transcriptional regulator n=1 Tax=Shimwellia pseudoproteus TaxID=570012 RepID=UPI0018EC2712|nr:LysR family transcriptional regulator [Shimwellia pseudoproteus]MBJ3816483.1 LysR family transcriptional regulator [Shimwellia pseudoproteus]